MGQYNGEIRILRVSDGKFKTLVQPLKVTDTDKEYYIKQLIVSQDGPYLATSDNNNCVSLFKQDYIMT